MEMNDFKSSDPIAWCPRCGNFGILTSLKGALVKLGKQPKDILLVSGIGQAAKMPHYVKANCFNGLHGRALPAAFGAKTANKDLTVVVTAGAGFVARGFSQETDHLTDLILSGINYKGFALIDVLQPCVTFNKKNTYEWYSQRVYKLDASYKSADLGIAFQKSLEWGDRIPIGILYNVSKPTYEQKAGLRG